MYLSDTNDQMTTSEIQEYCVHNSYSKNMIKYDNLEHRIDTFLYI